MSGFQILNSRNQYQRSDWLALWNSWPDREVFAHPAYIDLFTRPCDTPLCAVMDTPEGKVLFPFVLRPLAAEPWVKLPCDCSDLTSPYGYGGAFTWGSPNPVEFWTAFDSWAASNHIVSCFVRLTVFPDSIIPFAGNVEDRAPNVVRWLDLTPEFMWMDYEHKVRKNVKRSIQSGLRVEVDLEGKRLSDFLCVYRSTMDRRQAEGSYYFSREFFEHIVNQLQGQFAFFHVIKENEVVSSELVLVSTNNLYSFLGGTREEAFIFRPNDLLKHAVITWGIENHKKAYVLGGGYAGRDGIFRYKLSFAPKGEVPFRVGMKVYDLECYNELCRQRTAWEQARGSIWVPKNDYFPQYRAPHQASSMPESGNLG